MEATYTAPDGHTYQHLSTGKFVVKGAVHCLHNHPDGAIDVAVAFIGPVTFDTFKQAHAFVLGFPGQHVVLSQQAETRYYSHETATSFTVKEVN